MGRGPPRNAFADALMLTGGALFALDLALALASGLGLRDVGATWLGAVALVSSSMAFGSLWIARYRTTAPPPAAREPASG